MPLNRFSLIIATFLVPMFLMAQETEPSTTSGYYFGVRTGYGFLWAHRTTMSHLVNKHIPAFEISIVKCNSATKAWHEPFNNPQTGATIAIIPLGDDRLGTGIGLYPYILFPLGKAQKKLKLNIQFGWGAGWLTNKFEPLENHKNNAIGSHLNTIIVIRGIVKYDCSDKLRFESGVGITHFSNGALTLPNLGLNIPMITAGFHYRLGIPNESFNEEDSKRIARTDSLVNDRHWHLTTLLSVGASDVVIGDSKRYGVLILQTSMVKNTSRKHRFGGGIDLFFSQAVQYRLTDGEMSGSLLDATQVGTKLSYELVLGKFYMPIDIGVYAYSKYKGYGLIYNRFAIRYLVNDHLLASISLKAHLAKAEYWEVGIGWRI